MIRLPRFLPCGIALCTLLFSLSAADWAAAQARAATASAEPSLTSAVENFWHYAKIARYDLAKAEASRIITSEADPVAVLEAFEKVSADRKDNLDQWLLRWQGVQELREATSRIISILNNGYRARRSDPKFIEDNVRKLTVNERAYVLALGRLRESGEQAVPLMVDYLRDPAKREYHSAIRRALRDLGRVALNPLVAATEMQNADTLIVVSNVLGEIGGYRVAVPYLARLAADQNQPTAVRDAARSAIQRMGAGDAASMNAAGQFYELAERFYYDRADIAADPRSSVAYVWYWDASKGLVKRDVPPAIFNEIMAMRACEYVLKLEPSNADALSLWLAANYKREAELPADQTDPTRLPQQPDAHYYGVSAGAQYLDAVLARALKDRDSAVALKAIRSLQQIVGQSNLKQGAGPLADALRYPDRVVRIEAAFALAAALPTEQFDGQERVVPVLSEALAQTGKTHVLVVAESQDALNTRMAQLREAGLVAGGGAGAQAALSASASLPAVDVILIAEALPAEQISQLLEQVKQSPRLEGAARLVLAASEASPYAAQAATDPLMNVTSATDAQGIVSAIARAMQRGGGVPLDEELAGAYALRAAELLRTLAAVRGQVFDLGAAHAGVLAALNDERLQVATAAGRALSLMDAPTAQEALLARASDRKTPTEAKVSFYRSLAANAKFFGNRLNDQQVQTLQQAVESEKDQAARSAAAEARGALDLPADQARALILQQSRM